MFARAFKHSNLAHASPCVREVFLYLLREANHTDVKYDGFVLKRGQLFRTYKEIREELSWKIGYRKHTYSENQMKHCMKILRREGMVHLESQPRGNVITIINYNKFQNPKNYESTNESTDESTNNQPTANQSSPAINKNDKNVKNVRMRNKYLAASEDAQPPEEFKFKEKLTQMALDEKRDFRMWIIALYWLMKGITFKNEEQYRAGLKRELQAAGMLKGYDKERIRETMEWLKNNADFKWTLESVGKYIDEDLTKIGSKKVQII